MPAFRTRRAVRFTATQMFDLVMDVEAYPQFVPLCQGLRILSREDATLTAEMTVAYKMLRERFITRITPDREAMCIHVSYVDGPFSHLDNRWTFLPKEGEKSGCIVDFSIDYSFRSRTLGLLMGAVFQTAFARFAEAFEQRAGDVYDPLNLHT